MRIPESPAFRQGEYVKRKKISLNLNSGDEATDKLMQSIINALNDYILTLAKRQIQLAFIQSQKEIDDLHQRTREGIETARRNGKQIGQQIRKNTAYQEEVPCSTADSEVQQEFQRL